MDYKELQELRKYNSENVPNGEIYFNELVNFFYREKCTSLTSENIERIAKKIDEITKHILNHDYLSIIKYPCAYVWVGFNNFFEILDNKIHIEVCWSNINEETGYRKQNRSWLIIPINLEKSPDLYAEDELSNNMIDQIKNEIDTKILKQIKHESIRTKENRRSKSWENYNFKRAWKLDGTNFKVKRTSRFSSSKT